MNEPPSFTCPRCGMTSRHPDDIAQGYCGRCHDWTGDPEPGRPECARGGIVQGPDDGSDTVPVFLHPGVRWYTGMEVRRMTSREPQ